MTKTQTKIIIILNTCIVLLLCALFFIYPFESPSAGTVPEDEVHDVYRNARISLNVNLDFENNIGGSESESLIACFASPDQTKIHVFGNSASDDFDFKGRSGGIFFAITDRKAKIEKIVTIGGQNDSLVKVIMAEGGYLLGIDNTAAKKAYLLRVSHDGTVGEKLEHNSVSEESIADLLLMENCYMAVIHSGVSFTNFYDIRVIFYNLDYSYNGTAVLHNASYSQQYAAVLPKGTGKYVMAVNFKSELWNGTALVEFSQTTFEYKKIELENNYYATGFMPAAGGYAALIIDETNRASLITLRYSDYGLKEKKYLSAACSSARLFFSNGNYYTFIQTAERQTMYRFDSELSSYEDIALFSGVGRVDEAYTRGNSVIFSGGGDGAVLVGLSSGQNWNKKFGGSSNGLKTAVITLGSDTFILSESEAKDSDVGGNFGGKDIWIAKISL